jgi:hypothetical protein
LSPPGLLFIELPAELLAGDPRLPIDDLPPLVKRLGDLVERLVDEIVHDPFDLMSLEYEDHLMRRDVDAVAHDPGSGQVKRWPRCDKFSGTGLSSVRQPRNNR